MLRKLPVLTVSAFLHDKKSWMYLILTKLVHIIGNVLPVDAMKFDIILMSCSLIIIQNVNIATDRQNQRSSNVALPGDYNFRV